MATIDFQDAVADPTLVEGFDPDNDILNFQNVSSTEVTVGRGNGETTFTTAAGSVTLPIDLAEVVSGATSPNVTFADNSILFVGDNDSSTNFDDLAQTVAYTTAAHQIFGLGGNDTITIKGGVTTTAGMEIYGNTGSDSISGATGADTLFGGAGNDSLSGGTGSDLIYGNNGADTLFGGSDDDSMFGGQGADSIGAASGSDLVYGNKGADTIDAGGNTSNVTIYGNQGADSVLDGSGNDSIFGGTEDDTLTLTGGGNDLAYGNQGADSIVDGAGSDVLFGGQGADSILDAAGDDLIYGNKGDDTIKAVTGSNTLFGGDGADSLVAGGGSDVINGDAGDDEIVDGAGKSTISGGDGADSIQMTADGVVDQLAAGAGDDTISGVTAGDAADQYSLGDGDDVFVLGTGAQAFTTAQITGNAGNDALVAATGTYTLNNQFAQFEDIKVTTTAATNTATIDASGQGGTGYNVFISDDAAAKAAINYTGTNNGDTVTGGTVDDTITGGSGDDSLSGNDGTDTITGGSGSDTIDGGTGADSLLGNSGADEISGGAGSDTITGGKGEDTLTGGADNDDFFVGNAGTFDAVDTITDFNSAGTGDQLFVDAAFTTATGTTTLLTKGGSLKTSSPAAKVTLTAPQLFTGSSLADLKGAITNETGSYTATTFKALGYDTGNSVLYQFTVKASSTGVASATISIAGTSTIANVGNLGAGDIVLF